MHFLNGCTQGFKNTAGIMTLNSRYKCSFFTFYLRTPYSLATLLWRHSECSQYPIWQRVVRTKSLLTSILRPRWKVTFLMSVNSTLHDVMLTVSNIAYTTNLRRRLTFTESIILHVPFFLCLIWIKSNLWYFVWSQSYLVLGRGYAMGCERWRWSRAHNYGALYARTQRLSGFIDRTLFCGTFTLKITCYNIYSATRIIWSARDQKN